MIWRDILLYCLEIVILVGSLLLVNGCSKKVKIPKLEKVNKLMIVYDVNKSNTIISNKDFNTLITNYKLLKRNNNICENYLNIIKISK